MTQPVPPGRPTRPARPAPPVPARLAAVDLSTFSAAQLQDLAGVPGPLARLAQARLDAGTNAGLPDGATAELHAKLALGDAQWQTLSADAQAAATSAVTAGLTAAAAQDAQTAATQATELSQAAAATADAAAAVLSPADAAVIVGVVDAVTSPDGANAQVSRLAP